MDLFANQSIFEQSRKSAAQVMPLAERMRPKKLEEVVGQEHLIGKGKPLSQLLESQIPSMILWGPPGTGKTTLARLIAGNKNFKQISAVLSGVKELRDLVDNQKYSTEPLVLFVDEIHRWNKAQQDALLPHVENGDFTLIGATTENPSFSLISPLLSRAKVFVVKPLEKKEIHRILERALWDKERGLGAKNCSIDSEAWEILVDVACGDARRALNYLEIAANLSAHISTEILKKIFDHKTIRYDKTGDEHYNTISAFIKSMRGSDPQAAIYYFTRMYEAGEDPRFLARRMIIFASEDIGNADPRALQIALSAAEAFERLGDAEGWIPLSQAVTYLATAPKSNASYMAFQLAKVDIEKFGDLEIPMHLRNAPTALLRELGYGKDYQYAHNKENAIAQHAHLPKEIEGNSYYQPTERGYEKTIKERMQWLEQEKRKQQENE